ncbi:hypothetical protein BZA05DRAFT_415578 [Tricharina praecox]|uniref:uncharacterized protein n=1 Tax=Tricharina praecox TaxID=43433 RepID=UPI00221FE2AA|nr:uncharacterized protein BZA05DRAFT_415578 [Tricharina praecox]KAI5856857.1 hypothetical protein BZA05DRAFT_415578 [Tricharina praecox]
MSATKVAVILVGILLLYFLICICSEIAIKAGFSVDGDVDVVWFEMGASDSGVGVAQTFAESPSDPGGVVTRHSWLSRSANDQLRDQSNSRFTIKMKVLRGALEVPAVACAVTLLVLRTTAILSSCVTLCFAARGQVQNYETKP